MKFPAILQGESLARLLQGTALGAIAAIVVGFNWGGWTLGSTAEKQAEKGAKSAVVAALAPICVEKFQNSADVMINIEELKKQSSYRRSSFIEKGGWATFSGNSKPSNGVAKSCAEMLDKI